MYVLIYTLKEGGQDGIGEAPNQRDLRARLLKITTKTHNSDKAEGSSTPVAITHVKDDIYSVEVPNTTAILQIEGVVSAAWLPKRFTFGDIEICGYEYLRYQTFRDALLLEPLSFSEVALIDRYPYTVTTYLDYRLPKRVGNFFIGTKYAVGVGRYPVQGERTYSYTGRGAERRALTTPTSGNLLLPSGVYDITDQVPLPVFGWLLSGYAFVPKVIREAKLQLGTRTGGDIGLSDHLAANFRGISDDAEGERLEATINSLVDMKFEPEPDADPRWLTRCVALGRYVSQRIFFKGKPKGVYVKEVPKQ